WRHRAASPPAPVSPPYGAGVPQRDAPASGGRGSSGPPGGSVAPSWSLLPGRGAPVLPLIGHGGGAANRPPPRPQADPPRTTTSQCTVKAVATILPWWPRQERLAHAWHIRQTQRIVVGQHEHRGAQANALGTRCHIAQERQRFIITNGVSFLQTTQGA